MASKHERDVSASEPAEEAAAGVAEASSSLEPAGEPVRARRAIAHEHTDERRGRRVRRRRRWSEDDSDRAVDEGTRFARALAIGYLRQVELLSDITGSFASSVIDTTRDRDSRRGRRRRGDERERYEVEELYVEEDGRDDDYDDDDYDDDAPRGERRNGGRSSRRSRRAPRRSADSFVDLAADLYDGAIDAFRDLQDLPGDVVDEFYDSYDSYEPRRRRTHARRR